MINWDNPTSPISEHFTVHEAIWLPSWHRHASESDGLNDDIKKNLVIIFEKMDHIRSFFNAPIIVHCAYRSPEYSVEVGGTADDPHTKGLAVDWHLLGFESGIQCDKIRELLEPSLEALNIRMEKNIGKSWVHNDAAPVIHERYFLP